MNKLQTLKGFRDFLPEDQAFQTWFYENIKNVSESFGFQAYEGPTLEPLDLYAAKSGEELVKKQAFTLTDKTGKILALRPEMTPSLARMVSNNENVLNFPLKWYTYGRRFRYEQPQKGRGREFFQWDIDILGPEKFVADAEMISIAATFYKKLGLTPSEVIIKVNDRQFMQEKLTSFKIPQNKIPKIFKIIDKKNKVSESTFKEMLGEELSNTQTSNILDLLLDKNAYSKSPWLTGIFEIIKKMGLSEYVKFDASIVRGLDYYTRTVFEGWDVKGEFRSIWGGGRYDNLTSDVGSKKKIPGIGFAMGDMVIAEVLKANNKYPQLKVNPTKVLVSIFSQDLFNKSLEVSLLLRKNNINTELYPDENSKLDKQLKYADKKGIPYVVIIGPEEVKEDKVVFKNLNTKEQITTTVENLISLIK